MRSRYLLVLRLSGGWRFSLAAFIGRLPIAMTTLVVLLTINREREDYALAGFVAGCLALGTAAGQPFFGRWVDTFGQLRVARWQLVISASCFLATVLLAGSDGTRAQLAGLAATAGFFWPNVGSLVRARWSWALTSGSELRRAFAWEGALDQVIFILGPPTIIIVATSWGTTAATTLLLGCLVIGVGSLVLQRSSQPVPERSGHPRSALPTSLWWVVFAMACMGGVYGAIDVIVIRVAAEAGTPHQAGLVLAVFACSSGLSTIAYGARGGEILSLATVVGAAPIPLMFLLWALHPTFGLAWLAVVVLGGSIAPILVVCFQLLESVAPPSRRTESMALGTMGMMLGISASMIAVSPLTARESASTPFLMCSGIGVLLLASLLVVRRTATPHLRSRA